MTVFDIIRGEFRKKPKRDADDLSTPE